MEPHPHSDQLSDEKLLAWMRVGCNECFEVLFHRYLRQVVSISLAILRDRLEAEDILQEVFLSIYLQQEKYDPCRGSPKTWILQFAYYKSLLRRRYLRVRNFYRNEEIQEGNHMSMVNTAPYATNQDDWVQSVERAVSSLAARQRKAIELVHVQGCTLQETADALGESLANTRNHYYRGLKALRNILNGGAKALKEKQTEILEKQGALPV